MAASAAAVGGALLVQSARKADDAYRQAVRGTWRHAQAAPDDAPERLRELVRYATLAPSSHNTQCWRFRVEEAGVTVLPDLTRRCPVVDPDDHHLFVSLGCATESMVQAAAALGLHAEGQHLAGAPGSYQLALSPGPSRRSPLFEAIPQRQTTRGAYDGQPLAAQELALLEAAGSGPGVRVHLLTDRARMETVLAHVVAANTAQMRDPAFVAELKQWIRFDGAHAARTGDGLFAASSGNPTLPPWLGRRMFDLAFSEKAENDKYMQHLRSSAGVAVFVSESEGPAQWLEAGRAFQRFALQATVLGVRTAHLNQPVEVAAMRAPFARALGLGAGRPDLVVRFGRGPGLPRSLRRPMQSVLA